MDQTDLISHNVPSAVEENTSLAEYLYFALKVVLVLMILVLFCRRKKRDLKKTLIRESSPVAMDKVIVAIEIKDFFIQL